MEKETAEPTWTSGTNRKSWCDQKHPCRFCFDYVNVTMKTGGGMKQSCVDRPKHLKICRPGGKVSEKKPQKKSKNRSSKEEELESESSESFVNPEGTYFYRPFPDCNLCCFRGGPMDWQRRHARRQRFL